MDYGAKPLTRTGPLAAAAAGTTLGGTWAIVAIAVLVVLGVSTLIALGFRRGRGVSD
jgi:hypothetical protein